MSSSPPHIVLITADQLRKDALGCYGGLAVETPSLDRLAAASTTFEQAYAVSPWCMPSRCSLVTGLYPHNHGAYSNFRDCRLDPGLPNLYSVLRSTGYVTAHTGKCHYAPVPYGEPQPDRTLSYETFRDYYQGLGIDQLRLQDGKQVSVWFSDDYSLELDAAGYLPAYRDAIWNRDYQKVFPFPGPAKWHPDSWTGRKAAELIDDHVGDNPLFLWLSFSGPHFPFDAPDEYLDRVDPERVGRVRYAEGEFDDPDRIHCSSYHGPKGIEGAGSTDGGGTKVYSDAYWRELRTRYYANVALIDEQVGRVLEAVARRFGDNALIIFTADHGEMLGNHRLWGKHNCAYEDVLNVPLLVRYPGSPPAERTTARAMLTDIMPTCLDAAGVPIPQVDGMPLADITSGGGHSHVFAEGEGFISVSDGASKYVRATQGGRLFRELFDLKTDPGEVRNVINDPDYEQTQIRLQQQMEELFLSALLP